MPYVPELDACALDVADEVAESGEVLPASAISPMFARSDVSIETTTAVALAKLRKRDDLPHPDDFPVADAPYEPEPIGAHGLAGLGLAEVRAAYAKAFPRGVRDPDEGGT